MITTVPETPGKHVYNINIKYKRQGTCLPDINIIFLLKIAYKYIIWIKKIPN